eukprot:g14770.t1
METSTAGGAARQSPQAAKGPTFVNSAADRKGRRPSMKGMRRSCDRCGKSKKRCDGEWPCRRCIEAGQECKYSKRRSPHPQQPQHRQQQQETRPAGVHPTKVLLHSTYGAVLAYGVVSFKRCRLSASPATGLVGMKENAFLSDFFSSVGFLPLTNQSHIREAMMRLMIRPSGRYPSDSPNGSWDRGQFDAVTSGGSSTSAMEGNQYPMDPSVCTFWCAVALGALVKGSPIEAVEHYSRLAADALESYSGPVTADLAKASTILAYLYGFTGNKVKFEEQLAFSNSILGAVVNNGSTAALPVGMAEIILYRETAKWCDLDPSELESLCDTHGPPQIAGAADERELYTSATQTFRAFEQSVYSRAVRMSERGRSKRDEAGTESRSGSLYPTRIRPGSETLSAAMVKEMQEENLDQFERLEEAADRPSIRKGVGNLIISGTLVFNRAVRGDACGMLERISRCVEVYEQYPGLCRCVMRWAHIAHVLLGALAAMDGPRAVELYSKLRAIYNRSRLPGSVPVPPLEEWSGISSFCQEFHCRTLESFIVREGLSVFSSQPRPQASNRCAGHSLHDDTDGQQQQQQQRSASLFSEEKMAGSIPQEGTAGAVLQEGMPVPVPLERVLSAVLQDEVTGSNPQEGMMARSFPAQVFAGSFPVAAYNSGGDELKTVADMLETSAETCSTDYSSAAQMDRSDWSGSATSSFSSLHYSEAEKMPDADDTSARRKNIMRGKGGLDGLGDDPDMALSSRGLSSDMEGLPIATGDGGVDAPDWFDTTCELLRAIDDADPVSA